MASQNESRSVKIYIDGNAADATLKQITQSSRQLKNELALLVPGTEAFKQKMEELKSVNARLQAITDDIKGVGGAFGWLKTEIGKIGALAVGFLGFQFITSQFQNIIASAGQMSDSLAEVQRVTGLTSEEVKKLEHSLKQIDTRTSLQGLRDIARVAGMLGVSKENILGFTTAVDKLVVTLGSELGNADQITTELGKILKAFGQDINGDNLMHLGNAMVTLSNAGVATGGFIADFTQRVSGLAKEAKLSLPATMGLAAGLEELGQRSESSSTAVMRLMTDLGGNLPKAAGIAKMAVEDFTSLYHNHPEQALLKYAEGLQKNKAGFDEIANSFKDAGEEGMRVVGTLAALGNNASFIQGKIDMAGQSILGFSAINDGFALKNETLGAALDKLGKKFYQLSLNKGMTSLLEDLINLLSDGIDSFNMFATVLANIVKLVIAGAAAFAAYNTVLLIATVTQKAYWLALLETEAYTKLVSAAQTAWMVIVLVSTGRIKEAATAMRVLNITMEANPIGLVVAALTALVTALILFKDHANAAEEAQRALNKIHVEAIEKTAEEKDTIAELQNTLKDENTLRADKNLAIAKLRDLMPDHLKGYTDEQILAGNAANAIKDYVKALERRAEVESAYEELKKLKGEQRQIKREGVDLDFGQSASLVVQSPFSNTADIYDKYKKDKELNTQKALAVVDAKIKAIEDEYKEDFKGKLLGKTTDVTVTDEKKAPRTVKDIEQLIAIAQQEQKSTSSRAAYLALEEKIKKLKQEEEAITGKENKEDKKGESLKKKQQSILEQSKALSDAVKQFNAAELADQQQKDQKELDSLANKYNSEIAKVREFEDKIRANASLTNQQKKQQLAIHTAEIQQLTLDKAAALNALRVKQEEEMVKKIRELRTALGEVYQAELDKELERINNFYDDLHRTADNDEATYYQIEEARAKDIADAKIREEKRFQEERRLIDEEGVLDETKKDQLAIARINKKYDDELVALKRKFSKEKQATKEFQDAIAQIEQNRHDEISQRQADKNAQDQQQAKEIEINTAQQLSSAIFEISKQSRDKEFAYESKILENRRAAELNNKNLTESQKANINAIYDKQQADIKKRQWEADHQAALEMAIINGALAVVKALPNYPLAIAAGISAAIEIGTIAAQDPPQFADGGYSAVDYKKPQGFVSRPTLFTNSASGRSFSAGENYKTEYIVSSEQLKDPVVADFVSVMESNRGVRRFEAGGYSGTKPPAGATSSSTGSSNRLDRMESMIHGLVQVYQKQAQINEIPVTFNNRAYDQQKARNVEIQNNATL
jgi:TP901 family phage tail tape measure protein